MAHYVSMLICLWVPNFWADGVGTIQYIISKLQKYDQIFIVAKFMNQISLRVRPENLLVSFLSSLIGFKQSRNVLDEIDCCNE